MDRRAVTPTGPGGPFPTATSDSITSDGETALRLVDEPVDAIEKCASRVPPGARASHPSHGARRRPVLYISDNDDDRILFTRLARRWATVKLLLAETGAAGLKLAIDRRPQMVILDARIPDVDGGAALVVALRRRVLPDHAPIVVVSVDGSPSARARFIWAGASAYVARPLDVAEVDRTVEMLLEVATFR